VLDVTPTPESWGGVANEGVGVITVLPVFPYSRQPDVPYVRPDTPLANAPAMLFKDSFTVSSAPSTPARAEFEKSEGVKSTSRTNGPMDNMTATAHLTDRSVALGVSGAVASMWTPEPGLIVENGTRDQCWDEILEIGRRNKGNYRQWIAQAGTLVADLLTVAGTDHVITMDLHVRSLLYLKIDGRTHNSKDSSIFLWTIFLAGHC
jgi:ribose-phosphate pyrophosphokinase